MQRLISFDIDGTLEVGDPPGVIPLTAVRIAREFGLKAGLSQATEAYLVAGVLKAYGKGMPIFAAPTTSSKHYLELSTWEIVAPPEGS